MGRLTQVHCANQITGIVGGQITAVTETPRLTSAKTPWSGFVLETHEERVVRQDVSWGWHRTHVCLVTSGTLSFRVQRAGGNARFQALAGSVLIFPKGFDETRFSFDQSHFQVICVEIDPARAAKFFGSKCADDDGMLIPQFGLDDAHVGAILRSMAAEVSEGCSAGKLYGESLSLTLGAYLKGRFSANTLPRERLKKGFSGPQVQRLVEYIHANIGDDLDLCQLANLVDMSPRQFFRLFLNTFSKTPHQYLMNERVVRAKELLSNGVLLVEVAHALGFASQSHFSTVFRRATGTSPARFRQEQGRRLYGQGNTL